MQGVIFYYSGSGNTLQALKYMNSRLKNVSFKLVDIRSSEIPDLSQYAVVGFATFTDFWGISHLMRDFLDTLPLEKGKPAFVFNTYGFISGKTLSTLKKLVQARGFQVFGGHSLHTPENYPPMIARSMANEQAPNVKEMSAFDNFIARMDRGMEKIEKQQQAEFVGMNNPWWSFFFPNLPDTQARKDMGEKYVDVDKCTECGLCQKHCPYGAISYSPKPVFDMKKCYGCWACYNHCPHHAIYTKKYRDVGHYPKPIKPFMEKLITDKGM